MCTKRSVEGEVQIDEFEVFEGKEQNRIVKKYKYGGFLA